MDLKFRRLHPNAVLPVASTEGAAGLDITAVEMVLSNDTGGHTVTYNTGLAAEIPEGYVGLLFPRSSVHKMRLSLANSVGIIDADYRGEIKAIFRIVYESPDLLWSHNLYQPGDRVAQLMVIPIPHITPQWAEELTETARGEGGFGSTGQ